MKEFCSSTVYLAVKMYALRQFLHVNAAKNRQILQVDTLLGTTISLPVIFAVKDL
jgi:hypothetical protein